MSSTRRVRSSMVAWVAPSSRWVTANSNKRQGPILQREKLFRSMSQNVGIRIMPRRHDHDLDGNPTIPKHVQRA